MLVVGGMAGEPADHILTPPVVSADGTMVAYGARIGRELWWKAMGLRQGPRFK